jgi:hypothetical protein
MSWRLMAHTGSLWHMKMGGGRDGWGSVVGHACAQSVVVKEHGARGNHDRKSC